MNRSPPVEAFLHSQKPAAMAFARLHTGRHTEAETVFRQAADEFRTRADAATDRWPRQFWTLLMAGTRVEPQSAGFPDVAGSLFAPLGPDSRACLLLWFAADLSEEDAAAVLGLDEADYRLAMRRAAPRNAEGAVDERIWRAMAAEVEREVHQVSGDWPAPGKVGAAPGLGRPGSVRSTRWVWPATAAVAVLVAVLLAATFATGWRLRDSGSAEISVTVEPLPASTSIGDAGAAVPGDFDLALHPDFEWVMADADDAAAQDPAFFAWMAAALAEDAAATGSGVRGW